MKYLRKFFLSLFTLALVVGFSSCITTEEAPGNNHGGGGAPPTLPAPKWVLHPDGVGYDLDLVVNGREHHIDSGGEYMSGHKVYNNSGVPSSAISAYEVDMPDGEAMLYYVEPHGGGLAVYSRFWDPMEARHGAPRREATVRY